MLVVAMTETDLQMFGRIARAFATALQDEAVEDAYYDGIRTSACEVYAQLSAFYAAPKRSEFLKACGVWEPKDGNR
jgi:hypothetical protein